MKNFLISCQVFSNFKNGFAHWLESTNFKTLGSDKSNPLGGDAKHSDTKTELGVPVIFLDLRFLFASHPSDGNIAEPATGLKDLIDNGIIPAKRVSWLSFRSMDIVQDAALKWLSLIRPKTRSLLSPTSNLTVTDLSPPVP